jgi:hypothetical protein
MGRFVRPGHAFGGCLLAALLFFPPGCGDDEDPDEGDFDRYDACERMVSLCDLSRDLMSPCVDWIEQNFPNRVERILLVQCMEEALDCTSMREACNLEELFPPP